MTKLEKYGIISSVKGEIIMHYGLMICMPGAYKEIAGYSKVPGFNDLDENALTDIIRFTTSFENNNELFNFLKDTNLIPENMQKGYFNIALFKGKNVSILPYGIPYECDKKFYDINYLKFHFATHFRNLDFMYHFISEFYNPLKDVPIYREDLKCIRDSVETYKNEGIVVTEAVSAMENFIRMYSTKKRPDGKYVINFLNMHKLVMFTSLYRKRPSELIKSPSEMEMIEMEIKHYQQLLDNSDLTIEQTEIYTDKINDLENELNFLINFYRGGRK